MNNVLFVRAIIALNTGKLWCRRFFAVLLVLLLAASCSRDALPDVPPFKELGFADALAAVHEQVRSAYGEWQQHPRNAYRNGHLGILLAVYGKNDAAEVLYRRARILAPGEFRWSYYHGVTLSELGRIDEAIDAFRAAHVIDPNNVSTRLQLAELLLQRGDAQQSRELYKLITLELPTRVEGWLGLGRALASIGNSDAAVAALRRAEKLGPEFGEVHYALALVLREQGDIEAAARELAAYERTVNNTIPTREPLMRAAIRLNASDRPYMARADRQLQRGQFEAAVKSFRAALAINPASQDAWGGLVDALIRLDRKAETGESYRAALAAGISYRRLHLTYGQALMRWRQLDAAHDAIGRAIELDPQYTKALLAMGELEFNRGAKAAAVEHFRRALKVAPNDRRIVLGLARALNATGQFDEAVTLLKPLTSDPAADTSYALKELGFAYFNLGRETEAIEVLQTGRQLVLKSGDTRRLQAFNSMLDQLEEFGLDVNANVK